MVKKAKTNRDVRPSASQQAQLVDDLNLHRIIVPLDGKIASELVLPYAIQIANWLDSEINLLHIIRSLREVENRTNSVRYPDRYHDRGVQLASAYMGEVAQKLRPHCAKVRWGVATGETAQMIAARAVIMQVGLIIMKYRRKPFSERLTETNFDYLWRITPTPILVIDEEQKGVIESGNTLTSPERIIVSVSDVLVIGCIMPYLKLLISLTHADVDIVYSLKNVGLLSLRNARPPILGTELDDALVELEKLGSQVSILFSPEPLKTVQIIQKQYPFCWNITASRMRSRFSRSLVKSFAYSLVSNSTAPTLIVPFRHISHRRLELANRPPKPVRSTTKI